MVELDSCKNSGAVVQADAVDEEDETSVCPACEQEVPVTLDEFGVAWFVTHYPGEDDDEDF